MVARELAEWVIKAAVKDISMLKIGVAVARKKEWNCSGKGRKSMGKKETKTNL